MRYIFFLLTILSSAFGFSQKKVIDYTAFNDWKTLSKQTISRTGKFISYEINPHRGDGYLYIYNVATQQIDSFFRAKNASFSYDENYIAFTVTPLFDTLRSYELKKIDKKKWPKDTLAIYIFETDSLMKFANIKSHSMGEKSNWLCYLENENKLPSDVVVDKKRKTLKGREGRKTKKKTPKDSKKLEDKSTGTVFRVWNPINNINHTWKNITEYCLASSGKHVATISNLNDSSQLNVINLETSELLPLSTNKHISFKHLKFNDSDSQLAFLASNDTVKNKLYSLQLLDLNSTKISLIADSSNSVFPRGTSVSENGTLRFSKNGNLLYFGVSDLPKNEELDSLLETEKPKLDLWHYADNRLQPEQLKELKKDQKRTNEYVYFLKEERFVQLSNDTLNVHVDLEQESNFLLASSNESYSLAYQWDMSDKKDLYLIDLKNGTNKLLQKEVRYHVDLSRKADELVSFDLEKQQYYSLNIESGKSKCLTCTENDVVWISDINGMPMDANPEGLYGWSKDGNVVYFKSRNDIYSYNFSKGSLSCISNYVGKKNGIELSLVKWQNDSSFIDLSMVYFKGFNTKTKGVHLYDWHNQTLHELAYYDEAIVSLDKAKEGSLVMMRASTIRNYPDLELTDVNFGMRTKISNANPTQKGFNWASVELVKWKSYKGIELEGLLYKPENFDSTNSYPMIVYFYELYSDKLHSYYSPKPTASIVFPTEYASAGYFVFIPDIRYEVGHPANSAYDCIMSGTDAMIKKYPSIDSTRLGLQGQSWGGYQTAQLITMTTRYKAAMAGAPVSNMFSAYGGIRWGTGINRQFQYEKTQSRIGKTIWESPELYVENSPLFHLPKVTTPLLIMHNDGDGAVPWYQGIELYNGLRRLRKPCWLLNYNDDDHNLMKNANRIDLSIRMRQFFDYYLNNQPVPVWLKDGIPALKKGEELRYELDQN